MQLQTGFHSKRKMAKILLLCLLFLSCADEKIVGVPVDRIITVEGKSGLEFNLWAELNYDYGIQKYSVVWYGDIKNVGEETIVGLKPQAKLFFSDSAYQNNLSDITAFGSLYSGGSVRDSIQPGEIQQHVTQIAEFSIPGSYIAYLFGFVTTEQTLKQISGKLRL